MGRHTGERTVEAQSAGSGGPTRRPPTRTVLLLALAVTATLVAWGVLVTAAIDFGREARSGTPEAWIFLALATVGAAACLFVTLLLGARILTLLQGKDPAPTRPVRSQGGHRASR